LRVFFGILIDAVRSSPHPTFLLTLRYKVA